MPPSLQTRCGVGRTLHAAQRCTVATPPPAQLARRRAARAVAPPLLAPSPRCRRLRHSLTVVAAAAPKRAPAPKPASPRRAPLRPAEPEPSAQWRLWELQLYNQGWEVPWGAPTVAVGLLGWAASFLLTGVFVVPLLAAAEGVSLRDLAAAQKTEYILGVQAWETVQGIAIICACVRRFEPLPPDLFRLDASKPFSAENGWVVWGLLGYGATFVAIGGAAALTSLLTASSTPPEGNGTVDAIVPLIGADSTSFLSLLAVTSLLAPALEEVVFRGFLLPSLTKWMPAPAAVVASSVVFAGAHFAPRDFPQLLALGLVLGFAYVRTRNLLTPMLIHALWNTGVLCALTLLAAGGADLDAVVRGN